jgi:hypothetical protein
MAGSSEKAVADQRQADKEALMAHLGHEQPSRNAELIAKGAQRAVAAIESEMGTPMTPELAGISTALVAIKACQEVGEVGDLNNPAIAESLFDPSLARITVGQIAETINRREAARHAS